MAFKERKKSDVELLLPGKVEFTPKTGAWLKRRFSKDEISAVNDYLLAMERKDSTAVMKMEDSWKNKTLFGKKGTAMIELVTSFRRSSKGTWYINKTGIQRYASALKTGRRPMIIKAIVLRKKKAGPFMRVARQTPGKVKASKYSLTVGTRDYVISSKMSKDQLVALLTRGSMDYHTIPNAFKRGEVRLISVTKKTEREMERTIPSKDSYVSEVRDFADKISGHVKRRKALLIRKS